MRPAPLTALRPGAARPALGALCAVVAVTALACSQGEPPAQPVGPTGPPLVRPAVVARHAAQLDDELPQRAAGSQQEAAAAIYILGHLELAGYAARLDSVPVEDLVSSTNVVALPPRGGDPDVIVTVAYGDPTGRAGNGADVGLFLEVARALRAARADHSVEFVALGAQSPGPGGSDLGARRLVQVLVDAGIEPAVLSIAGAGRGDRLCSIGAVPGELAGTGGLTSAPACGEAAAPPDPFTGAPFPHAAFMGPLGALGDALVETLASLRI